MSQEQAQLDDTAQMSQEHAWLCDTAQMSWKQAWLDNKAQKCRLPDLRLLWPHV
jgi:hypothetical protein